MVLFLWACLPLASLHADSALPLEALINERLAEYPLTPDNKHRLAAWSELKGDYYPDRDALYLDFGNLGRLELYSHNCLLRTAGNRIYHLDRRRIHPRDVAVMNETLRDLFEQISLLANHDAHPDLVYFVDEHLAKKNLEPFEKLYLRHILIRFGQYDPARQQVEFRTEWLPVSTFEYQAPDGSQLSTIRKPIDPLWIRLDEATVRGYYLNSGGTVFVEDVDRPVFYATGEEYTTNVSAFKIFLQKLFTQTTHFVVKEEEARIKQYQQRLPGPMVAPRTLIATASPERGAHTPQLPAGYYQQSREAGGMARSTNANESIKPLYSPQDWIGRIVGILRSQNSLKDPEVLEFLVGQRFFPLLYQHLSPEEQAAVHHLQETHLLPQVNLTQ